MSGDNDYFAGVWKRPIGGKEEVKRGKVREEEGQRGYVGGG